MFAIPESGRASSSYTDYDAFVMLDHAHFILYTAPDDRPKFYLDLNIDDFSSNILQDVYWVFYVLVGDVLLDVTTVGGEEKLCNRSVYRFKSVKDTGEGPLQYSVPVFMTPK